MKFPSSSRRQLFFSALIMAAGSSVLAQIINLPSNSVPAKRADAYDVVIVGAGIAGLAAAVTLVQKNMSVLVVEARDRIGGRISTDSTDGYKAEMGSMFLPSDATEDSNPLSAVFTDEDTSIASLAKILSFDAAGTFYQSDILQEAEDTIEDLMTQLLEMPNSDGSSVSLEDMVNTALNGTQLTALENCILYSFTETQFGATPSTLSFDGFKAKASNKDMYNYAHSGSRISTNGLANVITDAFNKILSSSKSLEVYTGRDVSYINYEKGQYLKGDAYVQTNWTRSSGGTGGAISRFVLVTVPLGVLKANRIHFVPPIPGYYKSAISDMGFAHMEHVYLHFPHNALLFLSNLDVLIKVPTEYTIDGPDDASVMTISLKHLEGEDVLFTPAGGAVADMIAATNGNDTAVIELIMRQLLLIKPDLPQPINWKISSWRSDPYALGAMSYLKVGSSVDTIKQLGKPYKNRLFWAGEHTSEKYWGTIRGAFESGIAAANTISSVRVPNVSVRAATTTTTKSTTTLK